MEQENKQLTELAIIEFIKSVQKDCNIKIDYNYDVSFELFRIFHNVEDYNSDKFSEFLGRKIKTLLYDKDIFDFYITYDELI